MSAGGPGPELVGVEYCPDAGDLVAGDLECVHHHGDAVLLGYQAGLAVDRAFQERQAGCLAGDGRAGARDLLGALEQAAKRGGEAAEVTGHGGAGIEQVDEGGDVGGFPGLLEGLDDAGLPGGGGGGGVGGADTAAGGGGRACGRRPGCGR